MRWSDPTDCPTEAEEAAIEDARKADLQHSWHLMMDDAFEALASLDTTLANMPPLDPDTEAMITRPAAIVAGSVSLLDATMSMLNRPAPALALTMAAIVARYAPVTDEDARRAVEGTNLDMVA